MDGKRRGVAPEGEREEERYRRNERKEGERWDNPPPRPVTGQRRRSETTDDRDEGDETAHGGKGVVMKLRGSEGDKARRRTRNTWKGYVGRVTKTE